MSSKFLRIGELLLKENLINEMQLREALQIQKEEKRRLGDVLVDMGYVTKRQIRFVIKKYKKRIPLGEFLVESGEITEETLQSALDNKISSRLRLGEVLIEMGAITEDILARALSQQIDVPYLVPYPRLVDKETMRKLPASFIEQNGVLPLFEADGVTTILIGGPLEEEVQFHLEELFDHKVEFAICSKSKLDELIRSILHEQVITATPQLTTMEGAVEQLVERDRLDITERDLFGKETSRQAIDLVNYIVYDAIKERASDIHIEMLLDRIRLRYRVDGFLIHKTDLPKPLADSVLRRLKVLARLDTTQSRKNQEGRIMAQIDGIKVDLRVSFFVGLFGETVVMRILQKDMGLMDLEDLGMPPRTLESFRVALDFPTGIILFTGPTGCGKTTSLYASLNYLNIVQNKIVTIEDPVEYTIEGIIQGQMDLEHDEEMTATIRTVSHQDPDVIAVGEVFDSKIAVGFIKAALTGHKVMSTFHTDDTVGAVLRLMDPGLRTFLLSSTAVCIAAQRLVRKLCPSCKEQHVPPQSALQKFDVQDFGIDSADFYRSRGCSQCQNTGFMGRTGIFELLTMNEELRDAFLQGARSADVRRLARQTANFISLKEAGLVKAVDGITSIEEVLRVTPPLESAEARANPRTLEDLLRVAKTTSTGGGR